MRRSKQHIKKKHSKALALACIPIKNTDIDETRLNSDEVLLTYPIRLRPWFTKPASFFTNKSPTVHVKKLQLDHLGTFVWEMIDGKRTVREIIDEFAKQHSLYPKEAEVSVTQFLKTLGQRGLIGLVPKK